MPKSRTPSIVSRREVLQQATALIAGAAVNPGRLQARQAEGQTTRFFPGFKSFNADGAGAVINGVIGGQGPPVLLLHGAGQTHVVWHSVAPQLAANYTVVATDLRGYGDSSKPPDGQNHANYSKRATGIDQVQVMRHFGFDRFALAGSDRGARVAHRMAIDHPNNITSVVLIDIVPTYHLFTHCNLTFVQTYYNWFEKMRPAPLPENDLKIAYDAQKARATSEVQLEYLRTATDPANIHAMCEDYRAAASIDLEHDEADLGKKIACPLLVLLGEKSPLCKPYDMPAIWRERATNVTLKSLPGGHELQEDVPELLLAEVRNFLKG
jgi:haloacetate dehalogenase